jgi:hypothetical protein
MFKKAKLSFKSAGVFDKEFKPNIDNVYCVIARLVFEGHINPDGSINDDQAGYLKKYQLWSYIYYLYYYNSSTVDIFSEMKDSKGKASAVEFYDAVARVVENPFSSDYTPFDVNTLIYFINKVTHEYENRMRNPVIDFIERLQGQRVQNGLKKLTLITGVQGIEPDNIKINVRRNTNNNVQNKYKYNI